MTRLTADTSPRIASGSDTVLNRRGTISRAQDTVAVRLDTIILWREGISQPGKGDYKTQSVPRV